MRYLVKRIRPSQRSTAVRTQVLGLKADDPASWWQAALKMIVFLVEESNHVIDFVIEPAYPEVVLAETDLGSQFRQAKHFPVFTGVNCRIMASGARLRVQRAAVIDVSSSGWCGERYRKY